MDATATHLNVVDLLMAVIMATTIFIGLKEGILSEIIKLLGLLCTIFASLHYYERFANFLRIQFFGEETSTEFLAFIILAVLFYIITLLIAKGWVLILKFKLPKAVNRYGGCIFSILRSYFACGLVFFALILANQKFLTPQTRQSVSSVIFRYVAVDFYRAFYFEFIDGHFKNEVFNGKALVLIEGGDSQK